MKKYSMIIADLILKRFIFENFLSSWWVMLLLFSSKILQFNKTLLYKHKLEMSKLKKA